MIVFGPTFHSFRLSRLVSFACAVSWYYSEPTAARRFWLRSLFGLTKCGQVKVKMLAVVVN